MQNMSKISKFFLTLETGRDTINYQLQYEKENSVMTKRSKQNISVVLVFCMLLTLLPFAGAFAAPASDTIRIEARALHIFWDLPGAPYYIGPMEGGLYVRLLDENGNQVDSGHTDESGVLEFPRIPNYTLAGWCGGFCCSSPITTFTYEESFYEACGTFVILFRFNPAI